MFLKKLLKMMVHLICSCSTLENNQIRRKLKRMLNTNKYIFYTIGNMADKRKNLDFLIKGFQECL